MVRSVRERRNAQAAAPDATHTAVRFLTNNTGFLNVPPANKSCVFPRAEVKYVSPAAGAAMSLSKKAECFDRCRDIWYHPYYCVIISEDEREVCL